MSNDVAHSSCVKPIALPVWLSASSCCTRYSLTSYGLGMNVFTVEPPFKSQNDRVYAPIDNKKRYIDPSRVPRMLVMVSVAVPQVGITELIFVNTAGRWTASITAMSCCLSRCFQQSNVSQNVVYSQNNMLFTVKLVIFLCSVISQGKVVALDRWGGKWNHLSMTHRLNTNYAKNYCNRTLIVKVIVKNVVTFFGGTRCISLCALPLQLYHSDRMSKEPTSNKQQTLVTCWTVYDRRQNWQGMLHDVYAAVASSLAAHAPFHPHTPAPASWCDLENRGERLPCPCLQTSRV